MHVWQLARSGRVAVLLWRRPGDVGALALSFLLAVFPAYAESRTAAPNPDLAASVSEPLRPGSSAPDEAARARVNQAYGKLPLSFEANRGQTDARVDFLSSG